MSSPANLTYFRGWGLAEQIRWMLAVAPETSSFTQTALETREAFLSLRDSSLQYNQLPLLEIDGLKLVQSGACVRYLASRAKIAGNGPAAAARVDMACCAIGDARLGVVKWPFSPDKRVHLDTFVQPLVNKWFPLLEDQAVASSTSWLCDTPEFTAADVLLAEATIAYEEMGVELSTYTKVQEIKGRVMKMDGIKVYLESELRFPFPREGDICDAYVANVNTVLGR
ncbi:hypothetical protein TeGR_g7912 [Tetraparma gracilis]|uniref:Glutathione S-transferase n=1 Tax=Tetraparma gracilis TaxID=2962635 RepID=A0ABQ6MF95_9STRA|nr:hypothetical protein TeGR_g7912 [Tetraparma gracilis]